MRKKLLTTVLSLCLIASIGFPSYAHDGVTGEEVVTIESDVIELSKKEERQYLKFQKQLANNLMGKEEEDYSNIITEYVKENDISVQEKIEDAIICEMTEKSEKYNTSVKLSEDFIEQYENTYKLDEKTHMTINPLYIVITTEEIIDSDGNDDSLLSKIKSYYSQTVSAATTKSISYSESKKYYSIAGNTVFTVGLKCNFYYNGKKAWYKSGFDGWYTKGTLSVWQVDNWDTGREEDDSNYAIWCSGNFHWGLEIKGVGFTIDDVYITHRALCGPTGLVICDRTEE